jgi:hypothetical protein
VSACSPAEPSTQAVHDLDVESFQQQIRASKQPYVLVSFFRMDCQLFATQLPDLIRMQADSIEPISVMLISLDEPQVAHSQLATQLYRQGFHADLYHFDPQEAMPYFTTVLPDWDQSVPFNLIYDRQGNLIEATSLIDDKEVHLIVHADQSFPRHTAQP